MPVQCNICLLADTDTEWSVLNSCGHVFHTVCLQQELEYRRRCPNCRVDVPKCRGNSLPFRKVFFELSDELGFSQRGTHASGHDGDSSAAVDVAVGQLQMKLLVKEQQLQQVKIECKESSDRVTQLEAQAQELNKTIRKLQESKDSKIGEIKQLGRQNKQLLNENANLRVELNRAQTVEARVTLAMDSTLAGDALQHQLKRLVQQDISVPGWFPSMLEVRNKQLSAQTNKLQRLAQEKEQAEGHLRHAEHEKQRLREQVSKLKVELETQRQQQAAARSLTPAVPNLVPSWQHVVRDTALGPEARSSYEHLEYVPAPRFSASAFPSSSGSKLSLRQRMQRLSGRAAGQAGPVAVEHPGELTTSNGALGLSGTGQLERPAQMRRRDACGGAEALAVPVDDEHQGRGASWQQQQQQPEGLREGADEGYVLLEDSEDQQQPWGLALGAECQPAGAADEGVGWPEDPGGGCYSEVESEEELEIVEEGSALQQQQQQLPLETTGQRHNVFTEEDKHGQAARPCGGTGSLGGPLLGKRRSPDRPVHPQQQQQEHQNQPKAGSLGEARGALQPCNRTGYQPLPLKAGPSRLGAGPGTGPSFLRDPQRAGTGLEDGSKYIHRGPDGKGGSVSIFKAASTAPTKVLQVAGNSKKQKSKMAGGAGKGAAANGGCTIDLFFGRAPN